MGHFPPANCFAQIFGNYLATLGGALLSIFIYRKSFALPVGW